MSTERDLLPLVQLCPRCNNRGRAGGQYCTCPEGAYLADRDQAIHTLSIIWGLREATRWLEDVHPQTRERRIYMLRDGRADQVFDEIGKAAQAKGIPAPNPAVREVPVVPERAAETLQDTAKERMVADLRKAGRRYAADLLREDRVEEMNDEDRAFFDAMQFGNGYILDGQRIDPSRITHIRWGLRE